MTDADVCRAAARSVHGDKEPFACTALNSCGADPTLINHYNYLFAPVLLQRGAWGEEWADGGYDALTTPENELQRKRCRVLSLYLMAAIMESD